MYLVGGREGCREIEKEKVFNAKNNYLNIIDYVWKEYSERDQG